jgi:glycosyltransferase involved in cell wall biosynthesis
MARQQTPPLISIVIPCFNEALNIKPLYDELAHAIKPLNYTFELLFIDDGSQDDTAAQVTALAGRDTSVRLIQLARNFGKEIAVTAGLNAAKGEAAITIDADLQFPPAVIPRLLEQWERGAEVVVGVRSRDKQYAAPFKRVGSHFFYKIMSKISETVIVPGATDYRLLDRIVIDEFNRFTERNRFTRGLIDWLGFERAYVEFKPDVRQHGDAGYSLRKLFGLALNSFVSMSLLPLKLSGYIGACITVSSGVLGVFILITKYIFRTSFGVSITGTACLATLIIFLVGIVLMSLGLIATYIAAIHTEVMNRPLYVVRNKRKRN